MYKTYENYLQEIDTHLQELKNTQKKYLKCKKGCSHCCEQGDYPYSQIEFYYLTQGFIQLPPDLKNQVQQKIKKLLQEKNKTKEKIFEHQCPFLINKECTVYKYRGLICRTYGLAYYDEENKYVRLPDCVNKNLNYSQYYKKEENILEIKDVIHENLRIDKLLNNDIAKKYNIKSGEIRPMLDWLK